MTSLELRVARLTRFGFSTAQARALAEAGYSLFFITAESIGL
jgi:hypothetical protein